MINTLQIIHLKKEITILQRQIIGLMIDSLNLSLERIKDAKEFVERELKRANEWLNVESNTLELKLFIHFPQLKCYANGSPAYYDDINFLANKVDFIIDSQDK